MGTGFTNSLLVGLTASLGRAEALETAELRVHDAVMTGLDYDRAASARLERAYTTTDVEAQRVAVRRSLAAQPGERILDLGSGPGLLACELAGEVGANGRITAVDVSAEMNLIASRRIADAGLAGRVEVVLGDARSLAFQEDSFDAGVSTQVLEYLDDVDAVLRELHRVLGPGGRLVLLDTDWDTIVWASNDQARTERILDAWGRHAPETHLPRSLAPRLRACGFSVTAVQVVPLLNLSYNENTYSYNLAALVADFARRNDAVVDSDIEGWLAELATLDADGRYFFSLNRYLFEAAKTSG
jgi:ubiquinone/menaquinone biosynthesis C-methylase UbiE